MAVDTVRGNRGADDSGELADVIMPGRVAIHTAFREYRHIGPFVAVRVVAGDAGHGGALLKAFAAAEKAVLVAVDVYGCGVRAGSVQGIVVGQRFAGQIGEGGLGLLQVSAVTLCAKVELLLPGESGCADDKAARLFAGMLGVECYMSGGRTVAFFAAYAIDDLDRVKGLRLVFGRGQLFQEGAMAFQASCGDRPVEKDG